MTGLRLWCCWVFLFFSKGRAWVEGRSSLPWRCPTGGCYGHRMVVLHISAVTWLAGG